MSPTQKVVSSTELDAEMERQISSALSRSRELSIAFDGPVIPGEKERHQFVEQIRSYFEETLDPRIIRPKILVKLLQSETKEVARSLGVDLLAIAAQCRGKKYSKDLKVLPEFYGHLSPGKLAKLNDSLVELVKADSRTLEKSYHKLLYHLDVHVPGTALLPSDLLNALRAEGLCPPFEPSPSHLSELGSRRNIFEMEQFEYAIRAELTNLKDDAILYMPLDRIVDKSTLSKEESRFLATNFNRLKVEASMLGLTTDEYDIAGEPTPEEARVIVRRLAGYWGARKQQSHPKQVVGSSYSALQNVGVHPLISSLNVEYAEMKLGHLYATTDDMTELKSKVEQMLQPRFASKVTWEDLVSRIEQFVQKLPLRATTWNNRDVLAAIGLSGRTTISTPLTETPNTIDKSNLLDMLMAKALKKHYGNGTDEENHAIATCLKDRFGIDVTRSSAADTPESTLLGRSSADDMEAAMAQHQAETVPIRDVGR